MLRLTACNRILRQLGGSAPSAQRRDMARFTGPMSRVLIVDDEKIIAQFLQEVLQDEGYSVESADSAVAAFGCITRQWPDLILVDVHMPDMDGWTFLGACRQDPRGADLRAVVMSAAWEDHRAE